MVSSSGWDAFGGEQHARTPLLDAGSNEKQAGSPGKGAAVRIWTHE